MAWMEPDQWYRQLPTVHVAALALITDGAGRVLLVKQNYRPMWDLPGGMAEACEPPDAAVAREVREELGLDLEAYRLTVVDWAPPQGARERPLLAFVFDAGTVHDPQVDLQRSELDGWRFVPVAELDGLMSAGGAARVRSAVWAAANRSTLYLVGGVEIGLVRERNP